MGSAQSLFTPQNLIAAAILVAVVASAWYNHAAANSGAVLSTGKSTSAGKKGKRKRAGGAQDTSSATSDREKGTIRSHAPPSGLAERTVPGGIPEPVVEEPQQKPVKEKKRKAKKPATPATSNTEETAGNVAGPSTASNNTVSTSAGRPQAQKRGPANPSQENWTRVESRRRASGQNATTSDAGVTTASVTEEDGSSSGAMEKSSDGGTPRPQQTLAEKMLPKGRKTKVDDMLESSQYPELSRVMRVTPGENEKPASGFSWGDYEDVEDTRGADADGEDDGGWGVVKSRGKAKHSQSFTGPAAAPQPKASETMTKKQRQNAAKRDAAKVAKVEAEADRQAQLANHKRELERTRIAEQYARKGGSARSNVSGGMAATVNEKGHLVWD